MEGIVVLIVIVSWVVSAIAKSKQLAQKQAAKAKFPAEAMSSAKSQPVKSQPVKTHPVKTQQMSMPTAFTPAAPSERERPAQPDIQPRVMNRMRVTPETADMFSGSMNVDSHEGEDPCHEAELQKARAADRIPLTDMSVHSAHPQEPTAGVLDLSRRGLVNAFVMQEVLTRPCDRKRRMPMVIPPQAVDAAGTQAN